MRAIPISIIALFFTVSTLTGLSAVFVNPDFETGDLSGWNQQADLLTIGIGTNNTFNRNCAGRISGSFAADRWITNSIYQVVPVSAGDNVDVLGFVYWKTDQRSTAGATGYVKAVVQGDFAATSKVWSVTNSWDHFWLKGKLFGVADPGFESGGLDNWSVTANDLVFSVQSEFADAGSYALKMSGSFTDWSWNEAAQFFTLNTGDVVAGSARMKVVSLDNTNSWLVAGIKFEGVTNRYLDGENWVEQKYEIERSMQAYWYIIYGTNWITFSFTSAPITCATGYTYRAMVCGFDATNVEVYFDDVKLWKEGQTAGGDSAVTVRVDYVGWSGGAAYTSAVDVSVDSLTLKGSTANLAPATNILTVLRAEAAAIGTNASVSVPLLQYAPLNHFGYPSYNTNILNYPAAVEVGFPGWKFKNMTNNVSVTATNFIDVYGLDTNGYGWFEFDQYIYAGKKLGKERGEPIEVNTNTPYFVLGTRDGSGAEFGEGPFGGEHTYVVGTSLTNFPRRMTTDGSGGWPHKLYIVFNENFSTNQFTNSLWQKYFCLTTVPSNGPDSNVKALKIGIIASDNPASNGLEALSQELHIGWAESSECYGMVDYPNLTYQDHNEVALRAGWLHNLLDASGWYMSQSPRGSATIEPMDLFYQQSGNWTHRPYEEYLFTWPNAGSGVASMFDEDSADRLPGQASYHIGFKIGHANGTNENGDTQYPEVLNVRGCGYYRMTDYDGVMAGSFRPVAADIFGLYQNSEDAPLIPKAYVRLVPRTTPTNQMDDSHAEAYQLVRSKTNEWFIGTLKTDLHFAPDQVVSNGCYFDLEADTWANRAVVVSNNGPLAYFSQVSMHWRGGTNINDGAEGHDIDCVMVRKSDGEWVTHEILNPPTNIYQRTLASFQSNDVVYLMQQDRGADSYGFATEAPYKRASAFEITMLDDGGKKLNLDVFENNTFSEIADNVNITCQMAEDIPEGSHLHYKYRYRAVYAPGVYLMAPNATSGDDNWSNNSYRIEFVATDGHNKPLKAFLYYGNGKDSDWRLINTNETILVPTNTHRINYTWNTASVTNGAYYIKVAAQRTEGGKTGFDVSNTRLQVGPTFGFPNNGSTNITVVTNAFGYLGTNLSFEIGGLTDWGWAPDRLSINASTEQAYQGSYSAQISGSGWSGWGWNSIAQNIPCVSGEVLHVTGRIYIGSLQKSGSSWVACGIKMESTNDDGRTFSGGEYNDSSATGSWLPIDFERTAPVTGTDRLLLWLGGNDGTNINVYFDNLVVTSTNTGAIVTNAVRTGYWEGTSSLNVTNHNILSFWVSGTYGTDQAKVWVKDGANTTNMVTITNFVDRIVSHPLRVDIPWTNFASIDRQQVKAIGLYSSASNDLVASRMQSLKTPILARGRIQGAPQCDPENIPLYNPGQIITNIVTLQNVSGANATGLTIQAVQEYGEKTQWLDGSPNVAARMSDRTRPGDRLCGAFEQIWSNQTINAGSTLVLTNVYTVPLGRRVDHTKRQFEPVDWFFQRNFAALGRMNLTIRTSNGDNYYANDKVACYRMDDDYDYDNDGLSDAWEIQYSGSYTGSSASADSDSDGANNMTEYIAGTSPSDPLSHPSVDSVDFAGSGQPVAVWFNTETNRVYSVRWSTNLVSGEWHLLSTNYVAGDGGMKGLVDSESQTLSNRFYKIGVKFSDRGWPL